MPAKSVHASSCQLSAECSSAEGLLESRELTLTADTEIGGSMREAIETGRAPKPIGPYSQAVRANGFIFVSGQIAIDPESGNVVEGDVAAQTHRVMKNLAAILEAAGSGLDR